jgi:DNA primase
MAPFGDDRQRVLDATDIVRLIGEQVALKPKGREFVCLCPFHDDHAPSMFVVPHKQIYHCFSCGAGGNAITFAMNYFKMSFREALEHLAQRSGITLAPPPMLGRRDPGGLQGGMGDEGGERGVGSGLSRADLAGAAATGQTFFRAILAHPEHGRVAREAVMRREISAEMVEVFGIGAAPDKWDGLALTIAGKGLSVEPFVAAGLLKRRESGQGLYDAFRNRLMFPIHDVTGRVVGFGGRRLNDADEPKYINSPESALFDKSTTLYGLYQAGQAIRHSRLAIVTEGYMDTIACHQAGVRNAVATLGTALTAGNARVLRRQCDTVVLLFDGDQAGQRAAERGVEVFFAEPVDVKIAMLSGFTDAKDPDELLKRPGGREVFDRAIARAIDPLELLFSRVGTQMGPLGLSARSRVLDEFIARLVDLGLDRVDKVRYQLILKRLAQIAGVDWDTIVEAVSRHRSRARPRGVTMGAGGLGGTGGAGGAGSPGEDEGPVPGGLLSTPEQLLGCILNDPNLVLTLEADDWALIEPDVFGAGPVRGVAQIVADLLVGEMTPGVQAVMAHTDDPRVARAAAALASHVDHQTQGQAETLKRHFRERLMEARGARGSAGRGELESTNVKSPQSWLDNIARLREARAGRGNDPRSIPRPSS